LYHSLFIYVLIGIATHHWVQHFEIGDSEGPVSLLRLRNFCTEFCTIFWYLYMIKLSFVLVLFVMIFMYVCQGVEALQHSFSFIQVNYYLPLHVHVFPFL
jgi:hypothetical protein